jgi:hypothetical protein
MPGSARHNPESHTKPGMSETAAPQRRAAMRAAMRAISKAVVIVTYLYRIDKPFTYFRSNY